MPKSILSGIVLCLVAAGAVAQTSLTEVETRWLSAASAVVTYAKKIKLPIDVIVQPQARPGDVPFAMGFDGGRCKLVLSMRGNPKAEDILEQVPSDLRPVVIEAMTAHEIGHCWRYARGDWHAFPAGFVEAGEQHSGNPALRKVAQDMRATRREEGFSDLVALAWTQLHHPDRYGQVYAWLKNARLSLPVAGSSHDTLAWLRLARDGSAFTPADTPFEQARPLWSKGLIGVE